MPQRGDCEAGGIGIARWAGSPAPLGSPCSAPPAWSTSLVVPRVRSRRRAFFRSALSRWRSRRCASLRRFSAEGRALTIDPARGEAARSRSPDADRRCAHGTPTRTLTYPSGRGPGTARPHSSQNARFPHRASQHLLPMRVLTWRANAQRNEAGPYAPHMGECHAGTARPAPKRQPRTPKLPRRAVSRNCRRFRAWPRIASQCRSPAIGRARFARAPRTAGLECLAGLARSPHRLSAAKHDVVVSSSSRAFDTASDARGRAHRSSG